MSYDDKEIRDLMYRAHEGQTRKGDDGTTPYSTHPKRVRTILHSMGERDRVLLSAALLHDVIEDGPETDPSVDWATEVLKVGGHEVLDLVMWVTNTTWATPKPKRRVRKMWDVEKLGRAPRAAQTLKLADRLANLEDAMGLSPDFRHLYLDETRMLLSNLTLADYRLRQKLDQRVRELAIISR